MQVTRRIRRARLLQGDMPLGLEALPELALDLRWTWSDVGHALWKAIEPEVWARTENPWMILQDTTTARLEQLARDPAFVAEYARLVAARNAALEAPGWFAGSKAAGLIRGVAYFSMEFGLGECLPLYAGGLGLLAGDTLKTASDLAVPLVGVGLLYQEGYFRQVLDARGRQREVYPYNDPTSLPIEPAMTPAGEWLHVPLDLPGRKVVLRVWRARAGRASLYLLDSNDPLNAPGDRGITGKLYGGGRETRLLQEIALGIGGYRALEALGIDVDTCHLNEGHAAFATVERAARYMARRQAGFDEALWATRPGNVFTTHTSVAAGFDTFATPLVEQYFSGWCERTGVPLPTLLALGQSGGDPREPFNMAYLALRTSGAANGVSRLHGQVSRRLFANLYPRWPECEVPVGHVTNGIHAPSWDSPLSEEVWSRACGRALWNGGLGGVFEALCGPSDEELWTLRTRSRHELVAYARARLRLQLGQQGVGAEEAARAAQVLDPNVLTLGFARRFAEYKRPCLLLSDPERLARLLNRHDRPVQVVVAGKAHPDDEPGKRLVQDWTTFAKRGDVRARVVFLEDYDIALAQRLVQGVDVWVNNPRRPWEACGTSGMKVLVNGGLNLSQLDGWWAEAYEPSVGWALGDGSERDARGDADDALALYRLLEEAVVPAFYDRDVSGIPRSWVARVRASMAGLAPRFSSNRMLREYVETLYLPAALGLARRTADSGRVARELAAWASHVRERWHQVRFGDVEARSEGGRLAFRVPVLLGELSADVVRVELFADAGPDRPAVLAGLRRASAISGAVNGFVYEGSVEADRPPEHFTPRVVPHHPDAAVPLEAPEIAWAR